MFEKAYSKKGLQRYRMNKQMLVTETKETSDKDKITGHKNIGKKHHAGMLDHSCEPTYYIPKIEVEHEFMELASNTLVRLNANNKKMLACIGEFKFLSAIMNFKVNCADKEAHNENIAKALAVLDKLEREVMYFRPQLASDKVQKMRKDECSVLLDKTVVLNTRAMRLIDASTGIKTRIKSWVRNTDFDKCESSDEGLDTD